MGPGDYVLLELVDRLGGIQGRKNLQKLAYIARLAGAPIEDEFSFHYYGPYSGGLASRVDQLVDSGLLHESTRELTNAEGVEYAYELTHEGRQFLKKVRPTAPSGFRAAMERGISRAQALKDRVVFRLELAATLLYWREMGHSWAEAEAITVRRKLADREGDEFEDARSIAGEIMRAREQSEA